jgi:hypothetical protein
MSGKPINVLAAMDGVRSAVNCGAVHYGEWIAATPHRGYEPLPQVVESVAKVEQARTAVADLIAAARDVEPWLKRFSTNFDENVALSAFRAALANIGGTHDD